MEYHLPSIKMRRTIIHILNFSDVQVNRFSETALLFKKSRKTPKYSLLIKIRSTTQQRKSIMHMKLNPLINLINRILTWSEFLWEHRKDLWNNSIVAIVYCTTTSSILFSKLYIEGHLSLYSKNLKEILTQKKVSDCIKILIKFSKWLQTFHYILRQSHKEDH